MKGDLGSFVKGFYRLGVLAFGLWLMAMGMHFEMLARVILVPTDGFVQAVCRRTGRPFSQLKVAFDVSLLLVSLLCSWALLGRTRASAKELLSRPSW